MEIFWDEISVFTKEYLKVVNITDKVEDIVKKREENAHAHILNTFIGQSVNIPIRDGKLLLGTWQAVLYIELDGGKQNNLIVQTTKIGGE